MAAADMERVREPLLPQQEREPAAPAPRKPGRPEMRTAVVWAEILGKPKALKYRR
jgi:hypothetical protein